MQSLLQALNIGTLATWLSVSGASTVACLVPLESKAPVEQRDLSLSEGEVIDLDAETSQPAAGSAAAEAQPEMTESLPVEPVPVQEVAALPELADVTPLPEIPELPKVDDLQSDLPKPKPQTQAAPARKPTGAATTKSRATQGTPGATGVGGGTGNGSAVGNGSASAGAGAARLSKGRIPTPKYPEDCRRNNQEGRVVVTFTVDESGNVVSAKATGKSPYPAMDQAAIDAVYRGKFPSGPDRATASKAIVFKLR